MDNKIKYLKFNFDVSAYRLLGRELITDRITALFELVKNAYDANAENVTVEFIDVNPRNDKSKIIITDDGIGMSFEDIRDKWMVIGTSSKRKRFNSPPPYSRKVTGKKGVGRFAVDKLGAKLVLKTKQKNSTQTIFLETDWSKYQALEDKQFKLNFDNQENKFFTEVENTYWFEESNTSNHGTVLEISLIADVWSKDDIERAYKELAKLVSPTQTLKYPFNIVIKAPYLEFENKRVESYIIQHYTLKVELGFDKETEKQEIFKVEKGELVKQLSIKRICGLVKITLYYFNQKAKEKFKSSFPGTIIDGVKIYRDGIITTPFAEYVALQNLQKDLLGIDKRRWSGFFDKLSTRDLLGFIEITNENNPNIIEATNRQDFVDNKEWQELKLFFIEQLTQIEKYLKEVKTVHRENTKSEFTNAKTEVNSFKKDISEIKKSAPPEIQRTLEELEKKAAKVEATVNKGIKEYNELEKEKKQQENLFFSLISLQTYAATLSHITRNSIGHILRHAEYFKKNFPNPTLQERFKHIANSIYEELIRLRKGLDFMLKYAQSDSDIEDISMKELIENIFNNLYHSEFEKEKVKTLVEINKDLIIRNNRKSIEDIFDNLISNSLKALAGKNDKLIKCSGTVTNDEFILLFSDNGSGITDDDKTRIFDVFFTRTAEQGGAGMGLFIVDTRMKAMKGTIEVIDNELKPTGATFKLVFPFKK